MSIIDIIAREIGERPDLRGVSAPVVRAVADLAITALFDRLDETVFRPGLESTSLDDLSMCECGTISPECVTGEDCTLCPECMREAEKCPKSPDGKHRWIAVDDPSLDMDPSGDVRCMHCEPEPEPRETEGPDETCHVSPTGKHTFVLRGVVARCVHCAPELSEPKASGYLTDEMVEQARAFDASNGAKP